MIERGAASDHSHSTILVPRAELPRQLPLDRRVRRAVHFLAADCERFADLVHESERVGWKELAGRLLWLGRELVALTRFSNGESRWPDVTGRLDWVRQQLLFAVEPALSGIPVSGEEEVLLNELRLIQTAAVRLFQAGDETAVVSPAPVAVAPATVGNGHVLVVDDEPALRAALVRFVKQLGLDVVAAVNGREALKLAREQPPDLVLTDLNMPELDGIGLLRALKKDDRTRDIPVVVVSAQDDLESVVTCLEEGADDHITKPYNSTLLKARVAPLLERKRLRDVERRYLRRVALMTSAAEAVEREAYSPGMLDELRAENDAVARLARVFDRMVMGLRFREERLQRRLRQLRHEVSGASDGHGVLVGDGPETLASGEVFASRYEIRGHLGRGGMGTVYKAYDRELREELAIKVVRPELVAAHPGMVDRLKSEIRLARRISHRNVVRSHDLGEWNGTYFISMELVSGITVADLIDRRGRLSVEATLALGEQLADALATAHELQIVHRDIKPANLLVDEAGVLKVMDFGLARSLEGDRSLTQAGFVVGTPQYMAPEQLLGGLTDARSDLFSVGIVLFECLSGRTPFLDESPAPIAAGFAENRIPRLGQIVPDVPAGLEAIVHRLLEIRPTRRPQSAKELGRQLRELEHT